MQCGYTTPNGGIGAIQFPASKCGLRAPVRDVPIVDRIDVATRAQRNATVQVQLAGESAKDAQGRHKLVVGIELQAVIRCTVLGGYDAVPGYNLLSKFSNIFLTGADGFQYLAGVDGRDLIDDTWMRNQRLTEFGVGSGGLPAGESAGDYDVNVRLLFPLVSLEQANPNLRGAILLSELQARGSDALTFKVQDFTAAAGSISGVTDAGFVGTIKAKLHTVAIHDPHVYAQWQLESYYETADSGMLRHPSRLHEYLWVRPRGNETADLTGYTGATFTVGNEAYIPALNSDDWAQRTLSQVGWNLMAMAEDLYGGPGITKEAYALPGLAIIPRSRTTAGMAAGPVNFQYTGRSDAGTRYLHRTVMCQSGPRAAVAGSSCGCSQGYVALPVRDDGKPTTLKADPAATLRLLRR